MAVLGRPDAHGEGLRGSGPCGPPHDKPLLGGIAQRCCRHTEKGGTRNRLNAAPEAASIRFLTGLQSLSGRSVHYHDAWAVAGDGPGHTWTSANDRAAAEISAVVRQQPHHRRIDYILVGSWHAHQTARAEVHAAALVADRAEHGVWASDHFGVTADLELGNAG